MALKLAGSHWKTGEWRPREFRKRLRKEPIPGTTKLHRLQENVAAASIELSEEDLREIERATSEITVEGARYNEGAQRMINR